MVDDRAVEVRVSVIPTSFGASVILRILDRMSGLRTLSQLGLPHREEQILRSLAAGAHGMIIVTGPTGVGKTTTLYALLQELAVPERNGVTIEDPVEYEIPRIVQFSVRQRLDVGFANLLRAVLRHNPDVILVGEIRDAETADVAVRAALTGHLALTSLHTEKASHAVSALANFGVKPYALAPALRGVVAQQLVREICPQCRTRFEYGEQLAADPDFQSVLRPGETPSFSIGQGCDACFKSGYRGRRGICEILEVNEAVRGRIFRSAGADEIEKTALESGMSSLRQNGFRAALEGTTTVEEVVRAVHIE